MCRGQGGDHLIARDVTALFTEGWDWMQPVRDRDTGIFDSVELKVRGPCLSLPSEAPHSHVTAVIAPQPCRKPSRLEDQVLHIADSSTPLTRSACGTPQEVCVGDCAHVLRVPNSVTH